MIGCKYTPDSYIVQLLWSLEYYPRLKWNKTLTKEFTLDFHISRLFINLNGYYSLHKSYNLNPQIIVLHEILVNIPSINQRPWTVYIPRIILSDGCCWYCSKILSRIDRDNVKLVRKICFVTSRLMIWFVTIWFNFQLNPYYIHKRETR